MIIQTTPFSSEKDALVWASQHFSFDASKLIKEYPWAKIFKLNGSTDVAYLKLVPLRQLQVLKTHAVLSRLFGSIVPETIAVNETLGWQLLRNHGGIELGSDPSEFQLRKLLTTYSKIQADAKEHPEIFSSIPVLNLDNFLSTFLAFLKPGKTITDHTVNADYFLGTHESQEYYDVFLARKNLLDEFLKKAATLPFTLNHCDLHTRNAAEKSDGSSIIYDWDDALIGPAGLSLHALFSGCFKITQFLSNSFSCKANENISLEKRLLNHYITELYKQGYVDLEILQKALPASACAGAMQALLMYSNFPLQDDQYISSINELFVRRLDDLLNLCDYLSSSTRENALYFAEDYCQRNILFRAIYVYRQYLAVHPNDIEIRKRLAVILNDSKKWEEAIDCFDTIIEKNHGDAETFNGLGVALLKHHKPANALQQFELALSIDPEYKVAQINRDKATELLTMIDQARHPNKLPTVRVSLEERNAGMFSSEKVNLANSLFKQYGALIVENVFDIDMLQAIKSLVLNKYTAYFEPKDYDDCLTLGHRRYMVTVNIEGPINSPNLYDNPFISAITSKILGEDFILGGLNIGVSLPGSKNQVVHKDYPPLFNENDEFRENTPCFAIGILIPLVQHSHTVGTTLVIKESHKTSLADAQKLPGQAPFLDIGSCLMVDYRVGHQGLANTSEDVIRPLLTLAFHRSWFRDCVNYKKQLSITIDDTIFNSAPKRLKELISWARSETIINPNKLPD